jgi:hypothetical protein
MSRASESAERLKQNRDANVVSVPSIVAKRLARHFTFGRSRVLTLTRCGFFSEVSPHHHIVVCLISQIRRMLGQYLSVLTIFLPHPSSPYLSPIFPSVWLKTLWKASAAPASLRGGMKDVRSAEISVFETL